MNFLWGTGNTPDSNGSDWFSKNGWIILVIVSAILVAALIFVVCLIVREKMKEKSIVDSLDSNKYQDCFGGKDNIISTEAKGSRLIVVCKDYDLVSDDKLKAVGIDSTIRSTNKITCIIGDQAEEIAKVLKK